MGADEPSVLLNLTAAWTLYSLIIESYNHLIQEISPLKKVIESALLSE